MFLAAKYPQQAGVPVTGTYDDGPEWGTQPYTNMFASDEGSVNPKYPVNTQIGELPQGARRHRARRVRLRHLAVVEPGRHRQRGTVVQARRRQGRRARHHRPLRRRGLHQRRPSSPSRTASTPWCPPWTPTRTTPWPRRSSRPASSSRPRSTPPATSPTSSTRRPGRRCRATTSCRCSARGRCPTPAPSRCRPPWRSTRTSPRASSRTSASTRRGPVPTS